MFSLVLATAFLVLRELLTLYFFWCATGEDTLAFGRGEGGPSERWERGSAKIANAVHAFEFRPDSTLVARSDEPMHLWRKTRQPSSKCAPVLFNSKYTAALNTVVRVFRFVCISLMADQRARLPIPHSATLTSCLWSRTIFPSLPVSRLMFLYRDASSALLELINQWLNFTYSRSHAFRYKSQNTISGFHKNRNHDFRTRRCTSLPARTLGRRDLFPVSPIQILFKGFHFVAFNWVQN